jgi:DNA-binding response OmpR family regulator
MDRLSHRVSRFGQEIILQPREFRLLEYLMKHAGQVVTRTMLLENVWITISTRKRTSSTFTSHGCGRRSTRVSTGL